MFESGPIMVLTKTGEQPHLRRQMPEERIQRMNDPNIVSTQAVAPRLPLSSQREQRMTDSNSKSAVSDLSLGVDEMYNDSANFDLDMQDMLGVKVDDETASFNPAKFVMATDKSSRSGRIDLSSRSGGLIDVSSRSGGLSDLISRNSEGVAFDRSSNHSGSSESEEEDIVARTEGKTEQQPLGAARTGR